MQIQSHNYITYDYIAIACIAVSVSNICSYVIEHVNCFVLGLLMIWLSLTENSLCFKILTIYLLIYMELLQQ